MKLAWWTESNVLVKQWSTSSNHGLLAAMLVSCIMAVTYEYLRRCLALRSLGAVYGKARHPFLFLLSQAMLHLISVAMGNLLMLVVMTYNLWLLTSTVLGAGVGYFVLHPAMHWASFCHPSEGPPPKPPTRDGVGDSSSLLGDQERNLKHLYSTENVDGTDKHLPKLQEQPPYHKPHDNSDTTKQGKPPGIGEDDISFLLDSPPFKKTEGVVINV